MTPRSLFNLVLKVIGVLIFKGLLETVPEIFVNMSWLKLTDTSAALSLVISSILIFVFEVTFFYCLVFKTEWVIKTLKLDQGFDQETIPINMHRSTIFEHIYHRYWGTSCCK